MGKKKDSVLDSLLSEVDPSYARRMRPVREVRESGKSSKPIPAPRREMTQGRKNAFAQLVFRKEQSIETLRKIEGDIERLKGRIQNEVELRGHRIAGTEDIVLFGDGVIKLPNGKKEVIGAKGLLKFKQTGDIDAEQIMDWARKSLPHLVVTETQRQLDLKALQNQALQGRVPPFVMTALKAVLDYAQSNPGLIQETSEDNLDLAAYEQAKKDNKVPAALIKSAEKKSGHYALSTWVLDQAPRCSRCGTNKPKSKRQDPHFVCKVCSFEE